MDLKVASARATDVERAAVDALLGSAPAAAQGGARDAADHFLARGGAALRELRHLLLPTLHAVNDRVGWISRGAINYIAERLDVAPAEIYGVATFYALFSLDERPPRQVHVCVDLACRAAGGLAEHDLPPGTHPSPCLGACERAPVALAIEAGEPQRRALFAPATVVEVRRIAEGAWPDVEAPVIAAVPQVGDDDRSLVLLRRVGRVDPTSLDDYRAHGRLRGLATSVCHRPRRGHPRGHRLRARRTRRRGVPHRAQVGRRRSPTGPPAPSRLQRRRVGARNVQGPRPDRGRSVRADRVDDDRRLRDRLQPRVGLPARRVPTRARHVGGRSRRGARSRLSRRRHPRVWVRVRHHDVPRRRCLHLRRGDRDLQLGRGVPRRAAQQAPVPGRGRAVRQADARQQRRDVGQRRADRRRRRADVRRARHRGVEGSQAVLRVRRRRQARRVRGRVRRHAARAARAGRRRTRRAASRRSCWAAQPAASSVPTTSIFP